MTFPECVDNVSKSYKNGCILGERILTIVEAGWKNQSNWHISKFDTREVIAKKGEGVGRNQETGRKLLECIVWSNDGIEVVEQAPLRKCWGGKDGKITHKGYQANKPRGARCGFVSDIQIRCPIKKI